MTGITKNLKGMNLNESDDEHEGKRTLKSFNYDFNEQGKLLHLETGKKYEFNISTDKAYNQSVYEDLGKAVNEHVYEQLEEETKLKKVYLPIDRKDNEPQSFIFQSEDALTNPDKLLILVQGTGVVRAGQWSRRLIINDCLESGTQLPFIKRAVFDGYGVLVLNPNLNKDENNVSIRDNESALKHMMYVWDNIVAKTKAKHIAFISHSYGGLGTIEMGAQRDDFFSRVFAVAFTDSVVGADKFDDKMKTFLKEKTQNWVAKASGEAPDDLGHERSNWENMAAIFEYLAERYQTVKK